MFGIKFFKSDAMTYVVHFKHGKIKRQIPSAKKLATKARRHEGLK